MPELNQFYQKVKFIGQPNIDSRLADRVLGGRLLMPVSAKERVMTELDVVPVEGVDFLVKRNFVDNGDGELKEIQRIPLGAARELNVTNLFLFGAKVRGSFLPVNGSSPDMQRAYELIDSYKEQPRPSIIFSVLQKAGYFTRTLFP